MTIIGTAPCEFWFTTELHLGHYLDGVLTITETPNNEFVHYGVTDENDVVYVTRSDSYGPVGYSGTDLANLAEWAPYDDPGPGLYHVGGEVWFRFNDFGVGMARVGNDVAVAVLMEQDSTIPPGETGVAAGILLSRTGTLVKILGRNCENLIQSHENFVGVTFDEARNRLWINNDIRGLQYTDLTTNQHIAGPINNVSFYNGARWIEYQPSSDTLWVTLNELEIVGLNPDDFSTKAEIPFCSEQFSDDGPYSAKVFAILDDGRHMIVAGDGGLETDFNPGLWRVEMATGTKELVLGLDGSEVWWDFSEPFDSIWAAPFQESANLAGNLKAQRHNFWRSAPGLGQSN